MGLGDVDKSLAMGFSHDCVYKTRSEDTPSDRITSSSCHGWLNVLFLRNSCLGYCWPCINSKDVHIAPLNHCFWIWVVSISLWTVPFNCFAVLHTVHCRLALWPKKTCKFHFHNMRPLINHEAHLYVTHCDTVCVAGSLNCTITLITHVTHKDKWFAWSISIDPTEVSSMKLILFIVYKQHRWSLEEDAVQALTVCVPAQTCGERGRINFHYDHSFTASCFVYIKLNCNATPERYNWPQSQIKWL